jgi:hypothetical protein
VTRVQNAQKIDVIDVVILKCGGFLGGKTLIPFNLESINGKHTDSGHRQGVQRQLGLKWEA